jgi:hypothetical protein
MFEDVTPNYVPLEGGTLLHVTADSFTPIFNYSCKSRILIINYMKEISSLPNIFVGVFDHKRIPATILNSSVVTCVAPSMMNATTMNMTIVLNESNFNETGVQKQIIYYRKSVYINYYFASNIR